MVTGNNLLSHVYIGLIHYPVKRNGSIIASSITNLDIHDISRVTATYGLGGYFIIHPEPSQRAIAEKLAGHWLHGAGSEYNPDRMEALQKLEIVESFETAKERINEINNGKIITVGTSAIKNSNSVPVSELKNYKKNTLFILFGTAGGMADYFLENIDVMLDPIDGFGAYNHLSVRSAVSIFIDRLAMCM